MTSSFSRQFGGYVSLKLLSSPSEGRVARLPLRAITMLCAIAVVFSSIFGVLQWTMAGKMSASLDHVVSGSLNALAISQKMTSAMGDAHRFTISAVLAENVSERNYTASNRQEAFETYLGLLSQLQSANTEGAQALLHDCTAYRLKSDTMCKMVGDGNLSGALEFRTSVVRPAFEAWQDTQTKFGNSLLAQAENEKRSAQRIFNDASFFLLGAIFLPVIVGAVCLIAVILLLSMQLAHASRAGSQDAWEH